MDSSPPHANAELLSRFYAAFAALDAETMAGCYAADAIFQDEVFNLRGGAEVASMWRMLCAATRDKGGDAWALESSAISADERNGRAHWEARYRFSATGRGVHNIIEARFEFRDGLIVSHRDRFDFWSWSRQALGPAGALAQADPGFVEREPQLMLADAMAVARAAMASRAASKFKGASPWGPKIGGKKRGSNRPRIRLASVTVAGPPRP